MNKGARSGIGLSFADSLCCHITKSGGNSSVVMDALSGICASSQVSTRQVNAALVLAARLLRDESVGLHIGMGLSPTGLGALGFAALSAPDGVSAVRLFEEFQHLFLPDITLSHGLHADHLSVQGRAECFSSRTYLFWSFVLACRLNFIRGACGRAICPRDIALPCRPPIDEGPLQEFAGVKVRYGAEMYLERFGASDLLEPNRQACPEIFSITRAMAKRSLLEVCDPQALLAARLRQAVHDALARGESPILRKLVQETNACQHAHPMPGIRQLQRKLAQQGLSFRHLVADVRRERALMQLQNTAKPLAEIAAEAGYAETSSFHRAVRRWTGVTPMTLRNGDRLAA